MELNAFGYPYHSRTCDQLANNGKMPTKCQFCPLNIFVRVVTLTTTRQYHKFSFCLTKQTLYIPIQNKYTRQQSYNKLKMCMY